MLHLIRPSQETKQVAPEVSAEVADAMPTMLTAMEIGLDAGAASPSARQFAGGVGAAVESEPTAIPNKDLKDPSRPVLGVLAKIGPVTLKGTSPGEEASMTAIDSGPASDTYLFVNYTGSELPDYIRQELAA